MAATEHDHMYYRFEALLLAIELFTQRFDTEQLSLFSFDFVNEILTLNASALFIRDNNRFVMKQKRLYHDLGEYAIADTEQLRQIATFRGHIITKDLDSILEQKDIEALQVQWIMPLIIDDKLHGFIISSGNQSGEFTDADLVLSSTVMRLINNSLENSLHLVELQNSNKLLDQKNFNLFAINQSTKVLLSEMSLAKLHETATDIFSEVTTSQVTAFGILDPLTLKLKITGFRNVLAYSQFYGEFELRYTQYNGPVVLHIERDQERLRELFVNYEQFHELQTEYVVLIVKVHIIGMVTLSRPVNDEHKYDESIFALVESLANSAYIAISNAISFEEADRQRKNAQNKLRLLQTLNRMVKNVNECETPEELTYFTLKTMKLAFGLKKGIICFRKDGHYEIAEAVGFEEARQVLGYPILRLEDVGEAFREGRTFCDYTHEGAARVLSAEAAEWIGTSNCLVMSPLAVANKVALNDDPYPLGFLLVLETENHLLEEEAVLIETVAGNISPILHHMSIAKSLQHQMLPDARKGFLKALQEKISLREEYGLPFHLYYKRYEIHPFDLVAPVDQERTFFETGMDGASVYGEGPELFAFDGHMFALTLDPLQTGEGWHEIADTADVGSVLAYDYGRLSPAGKQPA